VYHGILIERSVTVSKGKALNQEEVEDSVDNVKAVVNVNADI
jgi:hypothetical protein